MSTAKRFPEALPVMYRAATVESIDAENRTVTFSLTSEYPVQRFFGEEILDHKPASIRQDRLKRGIPLLFGHSTNNHIGRIQTYGINNGKLTVSARFGNSALADEKFRDVQDGILVDVSGGYIVHDARLERIDDAGNEVWRVTDWEPVEGSFVPIPPIPLWAFAGSFLPVLPPIRCDSRPMARPQPSQTSAPRGALAIAPNVKTATVLIAVVKTARAKDALAMNRAH